MAKFYFVLLLAATSFIKSSQQQEFNLEPILSLLLKNPTVLAELFRGIGYVKNVLNEIETIDSSEKKSFIGDFVRDNKNLINDIANEVLNENGLIQRVINVATKKDNLKSKEKLVELIPIINEDEQEWDIPSPYTIKA